ncbi:MAG TPA: alkaline phosphatase family protein [Bryobacteraceae bacterium]|nr:alkaline phosphatase family protein [Bryobacteraceae bacterium]
MLHRLALLIAIAVLAATGESRRVVIVDLDGVRWDTLRQTYLDGKLPNFERILGAATEGSGFGSAVVFENASTVFPTVTMAAQASIFTGVFPAKHGIPGNSWFDRKSSQLINYMTPSSIACVYGAAFLFPGCEGGMANEQLQVPTLYELAGRARKSSTVVFNEYYKGATTPIVPSLTDALVFLGGSEADFAKFDTSMMDQAIRSFANGSLPDILTVYFSGTDSVAHQFGIATQPGYLQNVVDPQLGRLIGEIAAHDPTWTFHTLFVITSDHGRTDLEIHPEDLDLAYHVDLRLTRVGAPGSMHLAENGGMAYVYVPSDDVLKTAHELLIDPSLEAALDSVLVRQTPSGGYAMAQADGSTAILPEDRQALLAGLDSERAGNIILVLKQGHYFGNNGHGSNHGSIFTGDLNVPLLLGQAGVVPLHSTAQVSTTQIAATIAYYLSIPADGLSPALPDVIFPKRPVAIPMR